MHFTATLSFHAIAKYPPRAMNIAETIRYHQEKVAIPGGVLLTPARAGMGPAPPGVSSANF
jgi:hypothetical protein